MQPTYEEWRVRAGTYRYGKGVRVNGTIKEGFTRGPYTIGDSPVPMHKRSNGFDHAIFDCEGNPQWCGRMDECVELAEKWNESYALHLMVQGTAAERELYGIAHP